MAVLFFYWINLFPLLVRFYYSGFQSVEFLFTLFYSLLFVIPLFFTGRYSKRYVWTLFFPVTVLGIIDLFYAFVFKSQLVLPVMSTVFESNPGESSEFISMYLTFPLMGLVIFYVLIAVVLAQFSKPFPSMKPMRKGLRVLMLTVALLILPLKSGEWAKSFSFNNTLKPLILFGQYLTEHQRYLQGQNNWKEQGHFSEISSISKSERDDTIVLVIGESLTRRHMSLYGYGRPTTPLLGKRDLLIYRDVTSPSFVTVESLKSISTFATVENKDKYFDEGNIVDYFKQAGYHTFWFSNQQMIEGRLTAVSANAFSSDDYRFLNKSGTEIGALSFDSVLFSPLEEALKHPAKKKLIILHLLGSHMSYKNRYPDEWKDSFKDNSSFPPFALKDWQKEMTNAYDTSVLYTDWILDQILTRMEGIKSRASMVFLSDHGEEVFDSMNFVGHVDTSKVVFEIPLLIWVNKQFISSSSGLYKRMKRAEDKSWRSDGLPHLLIDLAELRSNEFDSLQSLISPVY